MVDRRRFLKTTGVIGTAGLVGLAGCLGEDDGDGEDGAGADGEDGADGDGEDGADADGEDGTDGDGEDGRELDGELEFVMSPSDPQETMEAQYEPVAQHLSEALDVDAETTYARDYSAVISALGSGTADVGEMGPFAAALGVRSEEVEIILQRHAFGGWDYPSVIVTRDDTDIEEVEDLEGATIAFADRLSASGALFPLYMLKEEGGLDIGGLPRDESGADFEATFSSHEAAVQQLESGTADAAAVGMFAAVVDGDEEREEYLDGIELVEKVDGIPRAPIAVSPGLAEEEKEAITDAFLDAPEEMYWGASGDEDNEDDNLWFDDVREADADDYEMVVDVARELGIEAELLDEEFDDEDD